MTKIQVTDKEVGSLLAKGINSKLDRITSDLFDEIGSALYGMEEDRLQYIVDAIIEAQKLPSGPISEKIIKLLSEYKVLATKRDEALMTVVATFCCTEDFGPEFPYYDTTKERGDNA